MGLHRVRGTPLPHERRAGPGVVLFQEGDAAEPPRSPPPARGRTLGSRQGAREPHKGNGKIVSHAEARLLPGLQAHNRTFVLRSRGQGGRLQEADISRR